MGDSQFNRCLLAAGFETIRFAYLDQIVKIDDLFRMLDIRVFELSLVLELILNCDIIFPEFLSKRLAELDERITESEVWRDPLIYCLLEKSVNQNESKFRCLLLLGNVK